MTDSCDNTCLAEPDANNSDIKTLVRLLVVVEVILSNRDNFDWQDWERVYDEIFCEEVSVAAIRLGFEWYDPDMGHEDDVMAFYWGLKNQVDSVSWEKDPYSW